MGQPVDWRTHTATNRISEIEEEGMYMPMTTIGRPSRRRLCLVCE